MEDQYLYFFIYYPRTQIEKSSDIVLKLPDNKKEKPEWIYSKPTFDSEDNNKYIYYKKIFKIAKSKTLGKEADKYYFEFEIGDDRYIISFNSKKKKFIYDISLEKGKRILDITKNIDQNQIEYSEKIDLFVEAIEKLEEDDKKQLIINKLYEDSIDLYENKKGFGLLISLFLNIYKDKDLCKKLLGKFKAMNENDQDERNLDRKDYLKDYSTIFEKITSEADEIIKTNDYNSVEFYGIILSYLNYFDYKQFLASIKDLSNSNAEKLYEILIIYHRNFINPIKQNLDFFNKFIKHTIEKKNYSHYQIGLKYIKDIEDFLNVINTNREEINNNYNNYLKPNNDQKKKEKYFITMDKSFKFEKQENSEENNNIFSKVIPEVIDSINEIIEFSKEKKIFLIYFTNDFWKYLLNFCKNPIMDNISNCSKLRKSFLNYFELVKIIFPKDDKFKIKNDAKNLYEIDEFAMLLDQIIKKYILNNKDEEDINKLSFITKYNPYYKKDNNFKYANKANTDILNIFDLDKIDDDFIQHFRKMDFEIIFKASIHDYISKLTSKIKNISNLEKLIKLINFSNIETKNIILNSLNISYDRIVSKNIGTLEGDKLKEAEKVVAILAIINFVYEQKKEDKKEFINSKINKLDETIKPLIFIEILKICIDDKEKEKLYLEKNIDLNDLKQFIFKQFSEKVKTKTDIDNILKLIECIQGLSEGTLRKEILDEFLNNLLTEKNLFKRDEFFSNKEDQKIALLWALYEKEILEDNSEEYYDKISKLMKTIYDTLDKLKIKKRKLDEFLNIDESFIIKRLELIKIISKNIWNPKDKYEELKKINNDIKNNISRLEFIYKNIRLYYKVDYRETINKLYNTIKDNDNKEICEFKGGVITDLITECENNKLYEKAKKIDVVNDFLLFKVIYSMNAGTNDDTNFNDAYEKFEEIVNNLKSNNDSTDVNKLNESNKKIFEKIKEYLSIDEGEAQKFIDKLIGLCGITNENLIDDLKILFKSKKYELDINSHIFFFKFFEVNNMDWNNKLPESYLNLSKKDFKDIKSIMVALKKNNIYDYKATEKDNYYNKLFTCLYDQKEALDFIFEKIDKKIQNIDYLKNKIQPTSKTINIQDVIAAQECLTCISKMKDNIDKSGKEDNFKILQFIKGLSPTLIDQFEKYSQIYPAIIELDRSEEFSDDVYEKVNTIIQQDLTLNISQDSKNFMYYSKKQGKYEQLTMKDLIDLNNKIPNEKENETKNEQKDTINVKRKLLIFFKNLIINLVMINKYMKVIMEKGCSLPINISIKVQMENVKYFLEDKEINFKDLQKFLLTVKNMYISQLNTIYKDKPNLRFLFRKQFRSMMKHIEKGYEMDSFLRYILNITDKDKIIIEGDKGIKRQAEDYISLPALYSQDSFQAISDYIHDLFIKNSKPIEAHYNSLKISSQEPCKGIYLQPSKSNTMEKYIINLFWEKLTELPIAQNVMITSKETSSEEIQSFLHRAILCNYNTLFVVEINESFSEYQQNIMNSYIDQLLIYQNNKFNDENDDNKVDKKFTQKYLDSCIVFIYSEENKKPNSFFSEMNKLDHQDFEKDKNIKEFDDDEENKKNEKILSKLGNIKVVTSDICGLGKSGKIIKLINDSHKKYFHFPLGGILSKNIIFKKLENLLNKIKNYNCKDVAIHLDLTESEEKSVMNEFFFSFLITKFYSSNENIIYIPNNIDIYVEVPNCFDDYLSKFSILNIFNKINIEKIPKFNYPKEIIDIFNNVLEIDSNTKMQKWVEKKMKQIGINKYSYHQINIFIHLFISQISQFKNKFQFLQIIKKKDKAEEIIKNVTSECMEKLANCIKYFIDGGFQKLLTGVYISEKEDYIDKLSEVYDKDKDLNVKEFNDPLIFIQENQKKINEKNIEIDNYKKYYIAELDNQKHKNSEDYLKKMKEILNLPNSVEELLSILEGNDKENYKEKDVNYVITNDNFKKMILLVYRIRANVPVIIMGETGCGKTALIKKLNQLLNNGKETVEIINIHPGITDDDLCDIMKKKNDKAKKQPDEELWLFFDEINTCLSLSLITEIFIKRTYNGNNISQNIRLIGACNPYRRRKRNKEKSGLSLSADNEKELVYLVQNLPQSLLYYVFCFGSIDDKDEKKYIHSIIEKLFTKEEKDLHEATTEAISLCHIYLRNNFDSSVVSLREITRFVKCVEFFKEYFTKKNNYTDKINNERNNKLRSIICSIYLCYYIRLIDEKKRTKFDVELRKTLFKLVNTKEETEKLELFNKIIRRDEVDKISDEENKILDEILAVELTEEEKKRINLKEDNKTNITLSETEKEIALKFLKNDYIKTSLPSEEKNKIIRYVNGLKIKYNKYYNTIDEKKGNLVNQFKNKELKDEMASRLENKIEQFSDFIKIEQDFLINQIELGKGIGKNTLLKENLFLLFVSVITNIPLIIIGKPGSGKSLSSQLIYKSMKGEYSKNKFFKNFPRIIQTYFQGSKSTEPKDVENLFFNAGKKLIYYKNKKKEDQNLVLPISMILFDELGLAELSASNPLKVLHSKLEYGGKEDGVSFVGISNYTLDAAKVNRALVLSVPDLDQKLDEIIKTSKNIVESISPSIKDDNIFLILSNTYFQYKIYLKNINELMIYKKYKNQKNIQNTNNSKINYETDNKSIASESNQQSVNTNIDVSSLKKKGEENEKRQFESIKDDKEFKDLMKKETRIRIDFHGNRDFYNLIRGIANDIGRSIDSSDNEKVRIIIKYIERNFGGIDYEIDINFNLIVDNIKKKIDSIKEIVKNGVDNFNENAKLKLKSVYLFKALYNLECDNQNSPLKISQDIIRDYNLNNCINDNIKDNNSRYLLLEVNQTLTTLIYQNIILQNLNIIKDEINLYDGSPFIDDNNKEYRFKKTAEIQEDAKKDELIIIENLNQIHPFLFDLYNRNFQMINGKKFARICLDNFDDQLTEVNNGFRIIILVDKRFVNKCDLAFLNRLEKMIVSFDQLLDDRLKKISNNLINDIKLKSTINLYDNVNYSLKNLLINCRDEEIQGLIYYFRNVSKNDDNDSCNEEINDGRIEENKIRDNVINKLYKILPQDIIAILPQKNILREKYVADKKIYNFEEYMKEEYMKYKISIIYTFTTSVDGLTSGTSFMISEIKSENDFKTKIEEIKNFNINRENQYICIHFEQRNSKNIKFICNFILNNFKDDYKYIIIIHINRNFNKEINEKIYSIPDINPDIHQIFIDNLNDNNTIRLNDILSKNIQTILNENREDMKLDDEFDKTLNNFLKKELDENQKFLDNNMEYINDVINYMSKEKSIKNKIIEITYKMIENKYNENESSDNIIENIFNGNYINTFTLDIVSGIIEYIKEEIFNVNLKKIFEILEDNNILTTLIENKTRNYDSLDKETINKIIIDYLDELEFDERKHYKCKFLINYNVPGFYNFYLNFSNYINKNIASNYFNNEQFLRVLLTNDEINNTNYQNQFQETEELLLNKVLNEVITNYKFVVGRLNEIKNDLILKDYITYYLQKYRNDYDIYNKDDIYHKIIILLLKLRFNEDNIIMQTNDNLKIFLIKILWIESNVNYILNILKLIDYSGKIFDNKNSLYLNIKEEIYNEDEIKIKYITNKKRNPIITKEVNQSYYILLAGICYTVTSEKIQLIEYTGLINQNEIEIEINEYSKILNEINNILQVMNDDLHIFLNEIYIIDELIKVIEILKKNINIEKINNIRNKLRENALIIQRYYKEEVKLSNELIENFKDFCKVIIDDKEIDKNDESYYDNLRYIFYKEIRKISDVDYRFEILNELLKENEMIKKSKEIFQMLLKEYLKKEDKFKGNKKKILSGDDRIIKLIDSKLNDANKNKFVLEDTLLYLFEKNSLIYYDILKNKKKPMLLEEEPFTIFKENVKYLVDYMNQKLKKDDKNKEFCKIFCLGYVKTFCYVFIKMFNAKEPKWKDPMQIINFINGDNSVCKMIRFYIYKILYNEYSADVFYDENIDKFKLKEYKDFVEFIQNQEVNNIYKIDYKVKTLKDLKYEESCIAFENLKKVKFKNPITKRQFNIGDYGIDNFYMASYNSTLSFLQVKSSEINDNFYKNICEPLFTEKNILLKALELFYDPTKYKQIELIYKINSNNIKPFLFGYRYCLNELYNENSKGIYFPLYNPKNIHYLKDKFYPGNDTKKIDIYCDIINHFKTKPTEGCYVCLCSVGYYHAVPSGFPGKTFLKKTCPKCHKNVGVEDTWISGVKIVKRADYYRIFKDADEIKKLKKIETKKKKLEEINYMTIEEFKKVYVSKQYENEKGVFKSDENNFKNDKKIIRNLSQISYRLLNYILYIHLFFARVITDKKDFDQYLPKKMSWIQTISECWNLLKNELQNIKIDSIDEFLHYIFSELFPILSNENILDSYFKLSNFEDKLEKKIQELIKEFKEFGKNNLINNENNNDKFSTVNLLKEKFTYEYYKREDFPYYEFFYYTNYLSEKYLIEKLSHLDKTKYPVLSKYLDFKYIEKDDKNKNLLDNLHLFNKTLNLISQNYFSNISRENAKNKKLKFDDIYLHNKETFDNFIKFYNDLNLKELKNKQNLSSDNALIDFFIDDDNEYGKNYIIIYNAFIKKQNERLENLLDEKIVKGIIDDNSKNKINIQQIKEEQIFTLNLPKKLSLIDILFNFSYRKSLDSIPISYKLYKEYEINYDYIEEKITESLLKNKKLLNNDITLFIYNNEVFTNKITDLITSFNKKYQCKNLIPDDKVIIYKFFLESKNINLYKVIINGFIELIKYLNNLRKDDIDNKDNKISENTKIYEIMEEFKDSSLNNFKKLFEKKDSLTIDKITNIFDYYLKAIFEDICTEIKNYQDKNLDQNQIKIINDYFGKTHIITKLDFAYAIRLFITLILLLEEDKENKIKNNRNNIINYLKAPDFWKKDIDEMLLKNLNELKSMNIQINQIISLYENLGKDIEKNYFDDVIQKINAESEPAPITNPYPEENEENAEENAEENQVEEAENEEQNDIEDLY